jgi:hypothetical protein
VDRVLSINPGVSAADWQSTYEKMLAPLPPGVYQLIVHLAYDDDEMRGATSDHPDWGAAWRRQDLNLVKSARSGSFSRIEVRARGVEGLAKARSYDHLSRRHILLRRRRAIGPFHFDRVHPLALPSRSAGACRPARCSWCRFARRICRVAPVVR